MVTGDPLVVLDAACEGVNPDNSAAAHAQVVYCQAWGQYLCADCRLRRNDAELKASSTPPRFTAEPLLQL